MEIAGTLEKKIITAPPQIKKRVATLKAKNRTVTPVFLERSLTTYLEALATALKTSDQIATYAVLKSEVWTKSCYDLLSKIITETLTKKMTGEQRMQMGTSLSSKTLQKIVDRTYKLSYPIDPRTVNTLNKTVIFLGYKDWNAFTAHIDEHSSNTETQIEPEEELLNVVREAVRRAHFSYCNLPEIKEQYLTEFYVKDSPAFNMIMEVATDKIAHKQIISNPYNPSSSEILDITVKKIEASYAQVYTKEYWLLCWWDTTSQKYVQRYKSIADHFYVLIKEEERWKIKTNASTSDPMELEVS